MKKIFLTVLVTILFSLNFYMPANASYNVAMPASIEAPVAPASEETVWYTRIYEGRMQVRLWSLTYQEWLTDWIDVEDMG